MNSNQKVLAVGFSISAIQRFLGSVLARVRIDKRKSKGCRFTSILRKGIVVFCTALLATTAHALIGLRDKASTDWINRQTAPGVPLTNAQAYFIVIFVDPPVFSISGIEFAMTYDPSRYSFREDLSGLLCEFSVGGDCPIPATVYGTHRASDLPSLAFSTGQPLPGSTLAWNNDPIAGLVEISYQLATPLDLDGTNRNFLALSFEAFTPYNPFETTVTFFEAPGNYDFNQVGFGCSPSQCGSNSPVSGFNVDTHGWPVAEPASLWLLVTALALLGWNKKLTDGRCARVDVLGKIAV